MFLSPLMQQARISLLLLLCSVGVSFLLVPPVESHESGARASVMTSRIENPPEGTAPSSDLVSAFRKSSWIWTTESSPSQALIGSVAFRNTFTPPAGKLPMNANILMTADNEFSLFVDGIFVGQSPQTADIWKDAQYFTVTLNSSVSHLFAVLATNEDGPGGLLAAIQIQFSDGTSSIFITDSSWIYTASVVAGWNTPGGRTSGWSAAQVIDAYGVGPWGTQVIIPATVSPSDLTFDFSFWIWSTESDPPNAPPGQRAFRKTFEAPSGKTLQSASIILTADNGFTFYANGQHIGESLNDSEAFSWKSGQQYTVPLSGTCTVFAVSATNLPNIDGGGESSAGLLAMIRVNFMDGTGQTIVSDTSWKVSDTVPVGFQNMSFDDLSWSAAHSQGAFGVAPWNNNITVVNSLTEQPAPPSIPANLPTPHKTPKVAPGVLAGAAATGFAVLLCITVGVYIVSRRRKRAYNNERVQVQNPYMTNHLMLAGSTFDTGVIHDLTRVPFVRQNAKAGPYDACHTVIALLGVHPDSLAQTPQEISWIKDKNSIFFTRAPITLSSATNSPTQTIESPITSPSPAEQPTSPSPASIPTSQPTKSSSSTGLADTTSSQLNSARSTRASLPSNTAATSPAFSASPTPQSNQPSTFSPPVYPPPAVALSPSASATLSFAAPPSPSASPSENKRPSRTTVTTLSIIVGIVGLFLLFIVAGPKFEFNSTTSWTRVAGATAKVTFRGAFVVRAGPPELIQRASGTSITVYCTVSGGTAKLVASTFVYSVHGGSPKIY
ncbi:hypothetical protein D9619_003787 [Psilocybe cf. subviscida]|uniref:PA14 domain-containing protein n=1 Tax=Psilocybe cf. subviscida TaxID=2480587 RepID=A0A8H5AW21_9AGAR|nr:hypothetical protein D9619_003787 [Psilocybe cf. subviscida]